MANMVMNGFLLWIGKEIIDTSFEEPLGKPKRGHFFLEQSMGRCVRICEEVAEDAAMSLAQKNTAKAEPLSIALLTWLKPNTNSDLEDGIAFMIKLKISSSSATLCTGRVAYFCSKKTGLKETFFFFVVGVLFISFIY